MDASPRQETISSLLCSAVSLAPESWVRLGSHSPTKDTGESPATCTVPRQQPVDGHKGQGLLSGGTWTLQHTPFRGKSITCPVNWRGGGSRSCFSVLFCYSSHFMEGGMK